MTSTKVFSTYVEVILFDLVINVWVFGFLHVCGGDPFSNRKWNNHATFSPRMWRWSSEPKEHKKNSSVFSTYVEVIPSWDYSKSCFDCFLHVCGGDPEVGEAINNYLKFSPRMWRWSSHDQIRSFSNEVFSTYVEVILQCHQKLTGNRRFLHVCGGDPITPTINFSPNMFSPRMWRWSRQRDLI